MTCCMCDAPHDAGTAIVDDEFYLICYRHLRIWQTTPEDISLREWCRRITVSIEKSRVIGKTWFCDWIDSMAVGS